MESEEETAGHDRPCNDDDDDSPSPIAASAPFYPFSTTTKKQPVRYRECMKNHAIGIGGHAVDGCGEFLSSGPQGSIDAFKCAACTCHRNFHRKEEHRTDVVLLSTAPPTRNQEAAVLYPYLLPLQHRHHPSPEYSVDAPDDAAPHRRPNHQFYPQNRRSTVPADGGGGGERRLALPSSSSWWGGGGIEDQEEGASKDGGGGGHSNVHDSMAVVGSAPNKNKKRRFRTKFTQEQKGKMLELAEEVGWRFQKEDEGAIRHFCSENGVQRQALKVWMHNNKLTLGKKP